MKKKNILVTGGAGFIGSHLVGFLLNDDRVGKVRVLDNLSTGFIENINQYLDHPRFDLIEGDIRNFDSCLEACHDMDLISHQAALGSVPRSVNDPITTNNVNITGFLNMLKAAVDTKILRFVFAASSSTYGDSATLPKIEENIGTPLSPYAVTKYVNELYAQVFSDAYNLDFIGLRYFNIFGPFQDPHGSYAAVIPLFMDAVINNNTPVIHGDGNQSRDFTYVANAVNANALALFTQNSTAINEIYNIACGQRTTLNSLFDTIKMLSEYSGKPRHIESRLGDVKHSLADISKAERLLKYNVLVDIEEGLKKTYDWYSSR